VANTQSACTVLHVYFHLCPVSYYLIFPHYHINGVTFGKRIKKLFKIKYICSLQLLSESFLMLRKTLRYIKNVRYIHVFVSYQLFLSDINETWIFFTDFRRILRYPISLKFVQWEPSCSTLTDRQTEITKLIVTFRNFANAPKNAYMWWPNECCTNNSGMAYRPAYSCVLIR
jgi:hypothetical protein